MGAWKPVLKWGGTTVIEAVVNTAVSAGCRTIVAGGHRYEELRGILAGKDRVVLVKSVGWRSGMDATIRGALEFLESESSFIVPGDMPLVRKTDFLRLVREWNGIFSRPIYNGTPGHPVLAGPAAIEIIAESPVGVPLKNVLSGLSVGLIPWDHPGVVRDLDTPDDYEAVRPADHSYEE